MIAGVGLRNWEQGEQERYDRAQRQRHKGFRLHQAIQIDDDQRQADEDVMIVV